MVSRRRPRDPRSGTPGCGCSASPRRSPCAAASGPAGPPGARSGPCGRRARGRVGRRRWWRPGRCRAGLPRPGAAGRTPPAPGLGLRRLHGGSGAAFAAERVLRAGAAVGRARRLPRRVLAVDAVVVDGTPAGGTAGVGGLRHLDACQSTASRPSTSAQTRHPTPSRHRAMTRPPSFARTAARGRCAFPQARSTRGTGRAGVGPGRSQAGRNGSPKRTRCASAYAAKST